MAASLGICQSLTIVGLNLLCMTQNQLFEDLSIVFQFDLQIFYIEHEAKNILQSFYRSELCVIFKIGVHTFWLEWSHCNVMSVTSSMPNSC
jgi:hypothetical protein